MHKRKLVLTDNILGLGKFPMSTIGMSRITSDQLNSARAYSSQLDRHLIIDQMLCLGLQKFHKASGRR